MRFISVLLLGTAFAVSGCEDRAGKAPAGEEEESDRDGYALGDDDGQQTGDTDDSSPVIEGGDDEGTPDDDGDSEDSPDEPEEPEEPEEDSGDDGEGGDDADEPEDEGSELE